jgi:hypothetical protein
MDYELGISPCALCCKLCICRWPNCRSAATADDGVHARSPTSLIWKQARARSCALDVLLGMNDMTEFQISRMVETMDFDSC